MRLIKARIQNYRSIIDTGYFEIEELKTILVGVNESGKTAILQALQQLNPPEGTKGFDDLRDYPRSKRSNDIGNNKEKIKDITIVEGYFKLTEDEKNEMPEGFENITYIRYKKLDNSYSHNITDGLTYCKYDNIKVDLIRLTTHMDIVYLKSLSKTLETLSELERSKLPSITLEVIVSELTSNTIIYADKSKVINQWIIGNIAYISESNDKENKRLENIQHCLQISINRQIAVSKCQEFLPKLILFSDYYRIKPLIHLERFAKQAELDELYDDQYFYGNLCLLKYLGFDAEELSISGDTSKFSNLNDHEQLEKSWDQLDERTYRLNAASIALTKAIVSVWNPDNNKNEVNKLKITADGQYLKVVVEDDLGVEVELNQRSQGFQWMVSFFVVFFAEAKDKHKNAILLLDEPGMSLHAFKQREFQKTLTKLSEGNQTIYTTHSPFLVAPDELNIVRVVEMKDRSEGTKLTNSILATDNGAIFALQVALGYDLAQSLFFRKSNLIIEGFCDRFYIYAISLLLEKDDKDGLDDNISLLEAGSASKIANIAAILKAQDLNVSVLFDSDEEGEREATNENLVLKLGKKILKVKDIYSGDVQTPELEDLLRETLVSIAKDKLNVDITKEAELQLARPIIDLFKSIEDKNFSKLKLAKAFKKWAEKNSFSDLTENEQTSTKKLINKINNSLK